MPTPRPARSTTQEGCDVRHRRCGRLPGPGRRQDRPSRPRADAGGGQEGLRQAAAQQRTETAGRLRQADREVRHRPGDRGPARLDRRSAADRRPRRGLRGRLPARTRHAADRRPVPGRGEDRREGRGGHRGRRPHHAAHPALAGADRRDHRRAHGADRLRPGPRRRGHPHQQPDTRPAHPVPPRRWNASSGPGWTTRPSPGSSSATDPRPLCGKPAAADSSNSSGPRPRAWPTADRRGLRRSRRTDRRRPGHRHPRHRDPVPGRLARRRPRPAPGTGSPDQQPCWRLTLFTRS